MLRKLKNKEIPVVRKELLTKQDNKCYMCGFDLSNSNNKNIHLDHSHSTGLVRSVLCARCNQLQGKVEKMYNRFTPKVRKSTKDERNFYLGLYRYLDVISTNYIHPTYKTANEKRIARNKKVRLKRKIKNENRCTR